MRTTHSKFLQALLLILAVVFAMPSQAQELKEGWYQIKRSMSASDAEKQLKDFKITKLTDVFTKLGGLGKALTREEFLYVNEEFTAKQNFLGIEYGKKTYGAYYKESTTFKPVKNGEVNTYFYVAPVEGETEAYTIRSYNGHYLHSDGTFSVTPETLYLGAAIDFNAEATKTGFGSNVLPGIINAVVNIIKGVGGYSVGKEAKNYELDPSQLAGAIENFVDPGIKLTIGYKEMSWEQQIKEQVNEEGDIEVVRKDYLDGKQADMANIVKNLAADVLSKELNPTDAMSIIRFVLRNFCSDAYKFEKINLSSVEAGGEGILGGIIGATIGTKELVPYTVQIEGWDNTFTVNAAKDYLNDLSKIPVLGNLFKADQYTHTNASVIITSDATHKEFNSAPIYNGGTMFAIKDKKLFGEGEEHSFIDKGDHGCSNVVILPYDYKGGGLFGVGANCVQDFSKCISAACVDEENHVIHVYFTEPGKEWKVGVAQNKFVTRHSPFALNIAASETESSGFMGMTKKTYTSEAYYTTNVNDEEVELVKLDGVIPAHTAVVIKNTSKDSGSHEFKYKVASKEDQALEAPEGNLLHGVCFAYTLDNDVNAYVLKTVNDNQKFYKLNQEDRALTPWRAYLEWNGAANSPLRMAGFDEEIEGIDTVIAPESSNAAIYDLSGRRVNSSNGVTISAGKKFINK